MGRQPRDRNSNARAKDAGLACIGERLTLSPTAILVSSIGMKIDISRETKLTNEYAKWDIDFEMQSSSGARMDKVDGFPRRLVNYAAEALNLPPGRTFRITLTP